MNDEVDELFSVVKKALVYGDYDRSMGGWVGGDPADVDEARTALISIRSQWEKMVQERDEWKARAYPDRPLGEAVPHLQRALARIQELERRYDEGWCTGCGKSFEESYQDIARNALDQEKP